MSLSLGARPWIYFSIGPLIGLICMTVYSIIYSTLAYSGSQWTLRDLVGEFFVFIFLAYAIGAVPALLTGLLTDITSRILSNCFRTTIYRIMFAACFGILTTFSLLILFCVLTNEMDELYKTDPLSVMALSIYGAIAAAICESLHIKLGSPDKIE